MLTRSSVILPAIAALVAVAGCAGKRTPSPGVDAAPPMRRLDVIASVPPGTGPVYLTGSLPELGPWDPSKFLMEGSGTERRAVLMAPDGAEVKFKFTGGSWAREAIRIDCTVPPDSVVIITGDTRVEATIDRFRDPSQECPWPDPTRWEADIRKFEAEDALTMPAPGGFLATGSSSIAHWHATIREDLAPLPVLPRGFGGSTMRDLVHYYDRVVLPYRPAAILVYEGDNDIAAGVFPETILAEFRIFADRVRRDLPDAKVYFLPAKPSPARWELWPRYLEVNAGIRALCEATPGFHYIDTATPLLGSDGLPRAEYYEADKLHLNREGYRLWTTVVRRELGLPPLP